MCLGVDMGREDTQAGKEVRSRGRMVVESSISHRAAGGPGEGRGRGFRQRPKGVGTQAMWLSGQEPNTEGHSRCKGPDATGVTSKGRMSPDASGTEPAGCWVIRRPGTAP